jgi:putative FmdB family regulatory protein
MDRASLNETAGESMPIFEYVCQKCNHQFEALIYGDQKAECPKCHTTRLAPQLSVFAVSTKSSSSSVGAQPSGGGCGTCGDPRGPGSCSMPDMN